MALGRINKINKLNLSDYKWVKASDLSYNFINGPAVVYKDEIHIFGGATNANYHYKFNGTKWSKVSNTPTSANHACAVVFRDELYFLIHNNLYKFNEELSKLETISTLPAKTYGGGAVVLNNNLHVFGGKDSGTKHYKWDGTDWTEVSTLPVEFYKLPYTVLDNELHIFSGNMHYIYNSTEWREETLEGNCPVLEEGYNVISFNGSIHGLYPEVYKLNGNKWESTDCRINKDIKYGAALEYNGYINIIGGLENLNGHYKFMKR